MADNYDGSIKIDTALDNTGFEKGSDELIKAIKDLTNEMQKLGASITAAVSGVPQSIDGASKAVDAEGKEMLDLFKRRMGALPSYFSTMMNRIVDAISVATDKLAKAFTSVPKPVQEAEQAANGVANAADKAAQGVTGLGEATEKVSQQTEKTTEDVSKLDKEVEKVVKSADTLTSETAQGFSSGEQVSKFNDKLSTTQNELDRTKEHLSDLNNVPTDKLTEKMAEIQAKIKELNAMKVEIEASADFKSASTRIEEIQKKLDSLMIKYDETTKKWYAKQGEGENAKWIPMSTMLISKTALNQYKVLASELKNITTKNNEYILQLKNIDALVEEFEKEKQALIESGEAFKPDVNTAEYQKQNDLITQQQTEVNKLKTDIDDKTNAVAEATAEENAVVPTLEKEAEQREKLVDLTRRQRQAAEEASATSPEQNANLQEQEEQLARQETRWGIFLNFIESVKSSFTQKVAQMQEAIKQGVAPGETNITKWTLLKKTVDKIGKAFKSNVSKAKNFMKALTNVTKKTGSATVSAKSLVKALLSVRTMLMSRIKRMFIGEIYNNIMTSVKALAIFSSEFNQAISDIKNRIKELAANITVTFGSIATAVGPMITKIVEAIDRAVVRLNTLVAQLKGQNYVTVAKKQTDSYADSLQGVSDSASSAADAVKEANETLTSYDQLHKMNSDTEWNKNSSKADATGDDDQYDLYKNIPVQDVIDAMPKTVRDIYNAFVEAVQSHDWNGAGVMIGEGLNYAMLKIDQAIPTLSNKATQLADTAARIGNGLVAAFNWERLGETIAESINGIANTLDKLFTVFDFTRLGQSVAKSINGLFKNVNWSKLGKTVAHGLNAIIHAVEGLVKQIDWNEIGTSIGTLLQDTFTTVDWGGAIATIVNAIIGIGKIILSAINTINWIEVGNTLARNIGSAVAGIDWIGLLSTLVGLVKNALLAVFGMGWGIGEMVKEWLDTELNFQGEFDAILDGIVGFFTSIVETWELGWQTMEGWGEALYDALNFAEDCWQIGVDTINGFFMGISDSLIGVVKWIDENVVTPFVDGFKSLFGIHSPSTVMAELGGYIIEGLKQGISNAWSRVTNFLMGGVNKIKNAIVNGWNTIKSKTSALWNGIKDGICNTFSAAKDKVVSLAGTIKDKVTEKFTNLKTSLGNKMAEIKTSLGDKFNDIINDLKGKNFLEIGENVAAGLRDGLANAWDSVTDAASGLFSGLIEKAREIFDEHSPSKVFKGIGGYLSEGLAIGIDDEGAMAIKSISNLANSVTDAAQIDGTVTMADNLDTVAEKLEAIADTFKAITNAITSMQGLRVPQVVLGSAVPAKVRVSDTSTNGGGSTTDIAGALSSIIELLTQANTTQTTRVEIPVKLDSRQLGQAIAEIERRNGRITNGGTMR